MIGLAEAVGGSVLFMGAMAAIVWFALGSARDAVWLAARMKLAARRRRAKASRP